MTEATQSPAPTAASEPAPEHPRLVLVISQARAQRRLTFTQEGVQRVCRLLQPLYDDEEPSLLLLPRLVVGLVLRDSVAAGACVTAAAALCGQPLEALLLRHVAPHVRSPDYLPLLVGALSGDRLGALLDLLESERMDACGAAVALFCACELLPRGGEAPPRLRALLRQWSRFDYGSAYGAYLGFAALKVNDPEVRRAAARFLPSPRDQQNPPVTVRQARRPLAGLLLSMLPEQEPVVTVLSGTLRRVTGRVGRNAPCPCGSGKKHKRCCADQEVARSPVAGVPLAEYHARADRHLTLQQFTALSFKDLTAFELDPLPTPYLEAAFYTACAYHQLEYAADVVKRLEAREPPPLEMTEKAQAAMEAVLGMVNYVLTHILDLRPKPTEGGEAALLPHGHDPNQAGILRTLAHALALASREQDDSRQEAVQAEAEQLLRQLEQIVQTHAEEAAAADAAAALVKRDAAAARADGEHDAARADGEHDAARADGEHDAARADGEHDAALVSEAQDGPAAAAAAVAPAAAPVLPGELALPLTRESLLADPARAKELAKELATLRVDVLRSHLISQAVAARDVALVRAQMSQLLHKDLLTPADWVGIAALSDNDGPLGLIEQACRVVLRDRRETQVHALASALLTHLPGLGILVGRAVLDGSKGRKVSDLLEAIEHARDRLGLPSRDRAWALQEQLVAGRLQQQLSEQARQAERERLQKEAQALQTQAQEQAARVAELERRLQEQEAALQAAARPSGAAAPRGQAEAVEDEAERKRLQGKISRLKSLIADGNHERSRLRGQLSEMGESLAALASAGPATEPEEAAAEEPEDGLEVEESAGAEAGPLRYPSFTRAAQVALSQVPARIAREALHAVAGLCAGGGSSFRGVKRLKSIVPAMAPMWSLRVGIHHRLLFRQSPSAIEVMELIHRKDLELTLKQKRWM